MRMLFVLLLAVSSSLAAELEVCNSGCAYSYVGAAITAASRGDFINLRAGQVHFGRSSYQPNLILEYKSAEPKYITIRSSRWRELPPAGVRIDPAIHGHLLATIANEGYPDAPVMPAEQYVNIDSTNATANTITFPYDPGWTNGTPFGCSATFNGATMPGGTTENVTYYVTGKSGATLSFAATPSGSAIDITSAHTGGVSCQSELQSHHYRFQGIRFQHGVGVENTTGLVSIASGREPTRAAMSHHIEFDHCVFCGVSGSPSCTYTGVGDYYSGPSFGLFANTNYLEIKDSWFGHLKMDGTESKGISLGWSNNAIIKNNRISGASINLLIGGSPAANRTNVPTGYLIQDNLFTGEAYYHHSGASGAPTGDCEPGTTALNGAYYVNTDVAGTSCSTGKCYVCGLDRTWAQQTSVDYRATHVLTKASMEFKEGAAIKAIGNIFRQGFFSHDSGNPNTCILLSQVAYMNEYSAESGYFAYNECREMWKFFVADNYGPELFTQQMGPVIAHDNLSWGMVKPSRSVNSIASSGYSNASQWGDGCQGCQFYHNTAVQFANHLTYVISFFHNHASYSMPNFVYENNIAPFANPIIEGGGAGTDCAGLGTYLADPATQFRRSVWVGSGTNPFAACTTDIAIEASISLEADYSITPGSKYAKDCVSGCGFLGTDGLEIGADIPKVKWYTSGAESGNGRWLPLQIDAGSTFATLTYTAPSTAATSVKLYTNAARTTLHGDTSDAGEQADDRTGNYSSGTRRIFKLGTNTALTASTTYYGTITAGTQVRPFELRTKAAGSGRTVPVSYATARTGEYADNPAFTSPTAISSAALHKVPVGANAVVWYRETGGIARAFVAP